MAFVALFGGASVVGRSAESPLLEGLVGKTQSLPPQVHSVIVFFMGHLEGHTLRGRAVDPMKPLGPQAHCAVQTEAPGRCSVCMCVVGGEDVYVF